MSMTPEVLPLVMGDSPEVASGVVTEEEAWVSQ
jgi:hypothetical protein